MSTETMLDAALAFGSRVNSGCGHGVSAEHRMHVHGFLAMKGVLVGVAALVGRRIGRLIRRRGRQAFVCAVRAAQRRRAAS